MTAGRKKVSALHRGAYYYRSLVMTPDYVRSLLIKYLVMLANCSRPWYKCSHVDVTETAMRHARQAYSETLRFRAPQGFGDALARAAARDFGSSSQFVRRVLIERLRDLGIEPNGDDKGGVDARGSRATARRIAKLEAMRSAGGPLAVCWIQKVARTQLLRLSAARSSSLAPSVGSQ